MTLIVLDTPNLAWINSLVLRTFKGGPVKKTTLYHYMIVLTNRLTMLMNKNQSGICIKL